MVMSSRVVSLVLCFTLLSVAGLARVFAADVSYKTDEYGRILVPVQYGDQTFDYLLATSSRRIGVRDGNLEALQIKRYQRSVLEEFSLAGEIKLPMAGLTKMMLAGRQIQDRYVTVLNKKSGVAGVLGFDALGEQLLHVDPKRKTVGLHAHAGNFSAGGWRIINGRPNRYGGIIVQTEYQGVTLDVLFASSLSRSMLDLKAYNALKEKLPPRKKRNGFADVIVGASANSKVFPTQMLPQFNIGTWSLGDVEVVTSRLNVSDSAGSDDAMLLIVGTDVIGSNELTLDYRSFQIWYPQN